MSDTVEVVVRDPKYDSTAITKAFDHLAALHDARELTPAERVLYSMLGTSVHRLLDFDGQSKEHREAGNHLLTEMAKEYLSQLDLCEVVIALID